MCHMGAVILHSDINNNRNTEYTYNTIQILILYYSLKLSMAIEGIFGNNMNKLTMYNQQRPC